jgi:recombination endonuclease VII
LFNDKEKWCPRCKAWLPLGDFGDKPSSRSPSKKEAYCFECKKKYDKAKVPAYRARLNAYQRRHLRFRKYKLTEEQVLDMLATQQHKCRICPTQLTLESCHIDHDHETGKVRGLLCGLCNRGLGNFKDDPALLQVAIAYLKDGG